MFFEPTRLFYTSVTWYILFPKPEMASLSSVLKNPTYLQGPAQVHFLFKVFWDSPDWVSCPFIMLPLTFVVVIYLSNCVLIM